MAQSKSRKLVTGTISAAVIASALAPVAASASTAHITTVYGPSTKTVYQGQSVSLPSTVMVKYSNGKKASVKVKWGKVPTSVGSHKVSGQVAGTTKTASITVVVKADSAKTVSYGNVVNVKAGLVPSPQKVTVTYYSGRTTTTTINLSNVNTSKVGSQMVKTTVAGKAVTVTVNVKAPSVKSATALNGKQIKVVFETGKSEIVDLPYTFKDGSTSTSFWYYGYNYKAIQLTTPYVAPVTVSSVSAINGVTSGNLTVASGNNTVTLQANDTNGKAITSGITWSTSDDSVASVTSAGKVVAVGAGSATITATDAKGNTATYKLTVAGQAMGIKLSAASTNLTANGNSTDAITATVTDSNGNTVTDFNGTATVALTSNGMQGTPFEDANGSGTETITFVNGVGTLNLVAPSSSHATENDTVSINSLTDANGNAVSGINYGTVTVNYVGATASALSLTPTTKTVSANANNVDNVSVNIVDSTGNNMSPGSSVYTTFTLTGPGSFVQGGTPVTTLSEYVTPGTTLNLPVYAVQGQTGNITVSATASGLTTGTAQINSVISTAESNISLSQTNGTVNATGHTISNLPVGTKYTVYTVQAVDSNGNPVAGSSDALNITDNTQTTGGTGGTLQYFTVDGNGQPNSSAMTSSALTSAAALTASGEYQFAVANTSTGSSNPTITVKDTSLNVSKTGSYVFSSGTPAYALFNGTAIGTLTSATGNVKAGDNATYTVQLQDANGNVLKTSGQNVKFYFGSNAANATINGSSVWSSTNPVVVKTDANGQAQVTVAVPTTATSGEGFTLDAVVSGQSPIAQNAVTVKDPATYTTNLALTTAANTPADTFTWPTGNANAGQTLTSFTGEPAIYVTPENAVGTTTSTTDNLQITTSNPKVLGITSNANWTNPSEDNATFVGTSAYALPVITAGQSGTATLTITDLSNPNAPKITETVSVAAGSASYVSAMNPDGSYDSAYTFSSGGVSGPFALSLVDAGGNPVVASAPTTLTASQVLSAVGASGLSNVGVRLASGGSDVSYVTIPQGQSTVNVYLDNVAANSSTTATAFSSNSLSAQNPVLQSASVTGTTVTLTFDNALVAANASSSALASAFAVSDAGSADTVTGATLSGNTITLTLNAKPANGDAVTLGYTALTDALTDGYGATVANIPSTTSVTNNN